MIKAIIFDCFGVLWPEVLDTTYRNFGGDPDNDRQFIIDTNYASDSGLLPNGSGEVFTKHFGVPLEEWAKGLKDAGKGNEELLEFIKGLREKYKVSVLSNVGKAGLGRFFDEGFLESRFDDVVESSAIGFAKPEARAYEVAAERLGVRMDECVFIDDRQDYIDGAQAVGMKTILYTDFADFKEKLEKII